MESTPGTLPYDESGDRPQEPSANGFAAAVAILGAAVVVAASVLPYAISVGHEFHLVDLDAPFKLWVWSAIQLWGTALVILVTAVLLIVKGDSPLFGILLIAFGIETTLLYAPILGQVVTSNDVDPRAGSFLAVMSGPIVLAGGIVAYRAWRATR
jgi:hypothetical protein